MVKIVPSPDLAKRNEYLPGVGDDGADVPAKEAHQLIDNGLALAAPDEKPAPADKKKES